MIAFDFIVHRPNIDISVTGTLDEGITTLTGPSGSGKSTILKSLAGLIKPETGIIKDNEHVWYSSAAGVFVKPQERSVGYMPQGNIVFPHLSVQNNLMYSKRRDETLFNYIIERLHLSRYLDTKAGSLSGGEQQRVALGRALYAKPHILLLDEPLSALDWELRDQVRNDLVDIIREWKIPCLWVTHDQEEAGLVGAYTWKLRDGRLIE